MDNSYRLARRGVLVAGVLLCLLTLAGRAQGEGSASVAFDPPSQVVPLTQASVSIDVNVKDVNNLGAFEFFVSYDPAILTFDSVTPTGFLGSTGRTVKCLSPSLGDGVVQWGCVTSTPSGLLSGPSGAGKLATVLFKPKATGTSPIVFDSKRTDPTSGDPKPGVGLSDATTAANAIDVQVPGTAVIKVIDPAAGGGSTGGGGGAGGSNSYELAPTPTIDPRLLTPTAVPTPDDQYRLTDQTGSSDPVLAPPGSGDTPAGDVGAGSHRSNTGAGGAAAGSSGRSSGVAGAIKSAGNFPIAGYGMARRANEKLSVWTRALLMIGIASVAIGVTLRRRGRSG